MRKPEQLILTALTALLFLTACGSDETESGRQVRIMLTEAEGITILGENPMVLEAGSAAEFPVELDEAYKIISISDNAEYTNGMIRLEKVNYSNTISVETEKKSEYLFELVYDRNIDGISSSHSSGRYYEGTEITLTAEPSEKLYFIGYSAGGYLADGGRFLSSSQKFTFPLTETMEVYCNFSETPGQYLVYHTNGGTVSATGETELRILTSSDFYLCPNTLALQGVFERDGYVLLGYNTEADGSGEYYGAGWNVPVSGNETELWLQWAEETPADHFVYKIEKNEAVITGYSGDDSRVVIPEEIDGAKVTEIDRKAFVGCGFEELVISRHVEKIQNDAFEDCGQLHTVYLSDNITHMTDRAFSDISAIRKIYINAVQNPSFSYALMGTGAVKFERLMTVESPKIVLISGSSSLYGMNSALFMEELDNQYELINYGCHATTPSAFFMELAAAFVHEGDLVITAPEPLYEQWGDTVFNTILWQIFEGAYNAFSCVDISGYSQVFSSFSSFNRMRKNLPGADYNYHLEYYSALGDYELPRPNADANHVTFGNGVLDFSSGFLTEEHCGAYNRASDLITEKGGAVLMSFAPTNRNALSEYSKKKNYRESFVDEIREKYHTVVISDLNDYLFNGRYFYDTDLHMSNEGANLRTKQLAEDVREYLSGEGVVS